MEDSKRLKSICEPEPAFIFDKKLVSIDDYAKDRGLSRDIVEDRGRVGIVQIRKYRGKTFVVDLPVSPYQYSSDEQNTLTEENTARLEEKVAELTKRIDSRQLGIGAGPVQKSRHSKGIQHSANTQTVPEPVKTEVKAERQSSIAEPVGAKIINRPCPDDDALRKLQHRLLAEKARSKRIWQLTALVLFVLLFAAFVGSFWFYMDHRIQLGRVKYAYATVQRVHNDFLQTKGQMEALQVRLADESRKLRLARAELKSSYAELQNLRDQLATARRSIELIQKNNSRKVRMLNDKIAQLTKSLKELIESSPPASGF